MPEAKADFVCELLHPALMTRRVGVPQLADLGDRVDGLLQPTLEYFVGRANGLMLLFDFVFEPSAFGNIADQSFGADDFARFIL